MMKYNAPAWSKGKTNLLQGLNESSGVFIFHALSASSFFIHSHNEKVIPGRLLPS